MWAALSFPVAVPVRLPAANSLSTGVPRKFQLCSQLRNLDTAEQKQQIRKKSQTKQRHQGAEEQVEEKREDSKQKLTGFDVLQALEKARARKMKQRNGTSSLLNSRKVIGEGKKGTPEDSALMDYGNNNKIVRALIIKEDWGTRLDELEKRLQQLLHTTPSA